jgi:hypothetical protein
MIFSCSMTDPGQPCVTISASAPGWVELTWMKWMSSPSISVMNCGSAFSVPSHARYPTTRDAIDRTHSRSRAHACRGSLSSGR